MTELFDTAFPPREPVIDGLLYSGTYLFVGAPKIGKPFFMAQLAFHVATGLPLWNYRVNKGAVLYLALEDNYARLQSRLSKMFDVESADDLYLSIRAETLNGGLGQQIGDFTRQHPDTRLIIVDTLQKIREATSESYSYALDYAIVSTLKEFSDRLNICFMVVHHTRKMESGDSFDMISGTNGLLGAADGAFVLQRKKRTDNTATMAIVGRDQKDLELSLCFDRERCLWELVRQETEPTKEPADEVVLKVAVFMEERDWWGGTATELLEQIPELKVKPNALTRRLNVKVSELYNDYGIIYRQRPRTGSERGFTLLHKFVDQDGRPEE
ncbi:MAG: helicase RepA family protein [Clostridiales bacterium]|nr:helicase RepA family protein [Clostridiales bacterium]